MGNGDTTRPLKTHIIRTVNSLRVILNLDDGCTRKGAADSDGEKPRRCEFHDYYSEKSTSDGWILRASLRFGDDSPQRARRSNNKTPSGEDELLKKAASQIDLAWSISTWSLNYLDKALQNGGPARMTVTTALGVFTVIPHCTGYQRLGGLTLFYPNNNIQLDFIDYHEIAIYESQLCTKPAPISRVAVNP